MLLGSAKVLAMRVYQTGIAAVTSVLLSRTLGATGYGEFIFVLTLVGLVGVPTQFGLSRLMLRETARLSSQVEGLGAFYRWGLTLNLILSIFGVVILAITLLLLNNLPQRSVGNFILVAGFLIVSNNLSYFLGAILAGLNEVEKEQLLQNAVRPSIFLVFIACATITVGKSEITVQMTLFAQLISVLLIVCFLTVPVWRKICANLKMPNEKSNRTIWYRSTITFMIIGGSNILLQSTDILMLGVIKSADEVAIYRIGAIIAGLLSLPLSAAQTYAAPRIAAAGNKRALNELQRSCIDIARASLLLTGLLLAGALLTGRLFIEVAYGVDYSDAFIVMATLGVGSVANVIMGLNSAVLSMTGNENMVFKVMGWSSLINLVLNATFIWFFGALGAAAATSATMVIWNIWLHMESHRTIGFGVAVFSVVGTKPHE